MKGKKVVSGVILTIIMIVLVLAAVVIIWGIINTFLTTQSGDIDVSTRCLQIDIQATKLSCSGVNNDVCDVTLSRTAKGGSIAGMKLVFTNDIGDNNFVHDISGNFVPLGTTTVSNITTGVANTSKVEIVAYLIDTSGNEQLCF